MEQAKDPVLFAANESHESTLAAITRLQELSTRLIQAGRLHALLKEILAAAGEITNTDRGNIQFVDPETGELRIVIHQGLSHKFIVYFAQRGSMLGGEKARSLQARVIVEDLTAMPPSDDADLKFLLDEGIRALQCTPLVSRDGRLLGMLNNHYNERHRPSELELRFLDLLARMAADLIERKQVEEKLRLSYNELEQRVSERTAELDAKNVELQNRADQLARLASEITLAEEQERHRMAHILHDHLQQVLVAAKLELNVLSRKVTDNEQQSLIADISGLMEESIRESRSLTTELSPPILHEAGLNAGLEWLARRMQSKYNMNVSLDLSEHVDVKRDDVSILCFQSVRELLFNSVTHAGVRAAAVNVRRNDQHIQITVSDKGRGFNPEEVWEKAACASGGFGLFSIRERLTLLGGCFEIDSKPGGGAIFRLTIPHAALAAPPSGAAQDVAHNGAQASAHRKIRILLADDHTVMRRGLASMLRQEPDLEVVDEAQDGVEAIEKARQTLPDIVLMDFSMPRMNGLEATKHIQNELPQISIIGLSMFDEAERAAAMIRAGACAYACKSEPPEVILQAIRNAFAENHHLKSAEESPIRIAADAFLKPQATRPQKSKNNSGKDNSAIVQNSLFD